ncbi:GAF domain-containing protein [Arachidicoccus sp.]|uniref:GAF domain-containing protein n=1 Tax=Arachidicoccus sp. TaxID=1872624 RepID=UPI003D20069D
MSESIFISKGNKTEKYQSLIPQIKALIEGEPDLIANMANMASALKMQFNWWWVGFYIVKKEELVLGPFQGPIACTRIKKGRGVCGSAWQQEKTLLVEDVNSFPGHIACSSDSKSEIVIPILIDGNVMAVLDVDSEQLGYFDETDKIFLEEIAHLLN